MKRLLLFATHLEAAETIRQLTASAIDDQRFRFSGGEIAITGMGLHNAQACASKLLPHFDECWNLGIAGAPAILLHTVVSIGKVIKHIPVADLDAHSLSLMQHNLPSLTLKGKYTLASSDFPIHDASKQPKNADLVDMEGYGIAFMAHYLGKPLRMWKVVSDFAQKGGPALIQENLHYCSTLLSQKVLDESCCHT